VVNVTTPQRSPCHGWGRSRIVARDENITEIAIRGDRARRIIGEPE
jgi:hypothetical protein